MHAWHESAVRDDGSRRQQSAQTVNVMTVKHPFHVRALSSQGSPLGCMPSSPVPWLGACGWRASSSPSCPKAGRSARQNKVQRGAGPRNKVLCTEYHHRTVPQLRHTGTVFSLFPAPCACHMPSPISLMAHGCIPYVLPPYRMLLCMLHPLKVSLLPCRSWSQPQSGS